MPRVLSLSLLVAIVATPVAPVMADDGHTFLNCTEARAAGTSNIRRGTYGYGPHLDRDNDGVGCES